MKLTKATKEEFEEYSTLKKNEVIEYEKLIGLKIPYSKKECKQEFLKVLKSKKDYLILAKENKKIMGFIQMSIEKNKAEIDYLYVSKENRKKGIAKELIKKSTKLAKSKKANNLFLKVNAKNKNALALYERLNFKITNYIMKKEIK